MLMSILVAKAVHNDSVVVQQIHSIKVVWLVNVQPLL